ncbi:hypothetical protein Tco_0417568 [Tanacetum coccineum]
MNDITIDLTGVEDPTDEDGDIEMGDSTGVSVSLGGGISSEGGNKYSLKDKNEAKTEHENGKSVLEGNPVILDPNQVVDVHDPNEMVDIPNDVDLVDYDGDDEENPEEDPKEDLKEDPEEDPKKNRNQIMGMGISLPNILTHSPWSVDKTPPPGNVSSDFVSSDSVSSNSESEHVKALRRDLETSRARARELEVKWFSCQAEIALLKSNKRLKVLENGENATGSDMEMVRNESVSKPKPPVLMMRMTVSSQERIERNLFDLGTEGSSEPHGTPSDSL